MRMNVNQRPGLFQARFDFSFSSIATEKIIAVLYVISLVGVALAAVVVIAAGFRAGFAEGLPALIIGAPLILFFGAIYVRLILESLIVLFRIADHTREIAEQGRRAP